MVACVTVIPPYLEKFDVQAMAMEILKTIPCPVPEFFDPRLFFVTNKPSLATMLMAIQSIILLPQGTFYVLHTWYHLVYAHSTRVSAETRKMQFRFLLGSLMQIMIPSTLFMNPILYIWFSVNTGYYNQEINNHLIFIVSFHGLLGTTCMILVHKSYRNHLVKMITLGKFPRQNVIRTNPISVIVSSARLVGQNVH
ncbi:hypothetical protein GCK72_016723 [Caenorhabditis remanei]|uniref:Serpentine Receptor, class H n=1 Tax=Caenorhabditis remanei TaxID=31234 RepID=A0A6A5G5N4_CAERE|nr:hypothetical protein GCK72_016723 [Caenorhabditis remanei]KAF1750176.1 hypothetical protein GCK72_016723 [Caenorhabditis remanei]